MTDRVLLGKSNSNKQGLWVSKPGVDVTALAGNTYLQSLGDWYGYQEEFDGDGTDGSFTTGTEPFSGFLGTSLRTTASGTLIYTGGENDIVIRTKQNFTGSGASAKPTAGAFIGSEYPIIEMRIRMLFDPVLSFPPALGAASHLQVFFVNADINGLNTLDEGAGNKVIYGGNYNNVFEDGVGVWKILEWDMSGVPAWMDPYAHNGSTGPYSSAFRIARIRFDLTHGSAAGPWTPTTNPMWEIDYVRVKKKGIPPNVGKHGSVQDALLFDSDVSAMGIVHQTGIVTIGTAKARSDGTTSDIVVGGNTDTSANGYVSFPALDYIPLVLFQRIDENVETTGRTFPGGGEEVSICTTNWEDYRFPTTDQNTSEPSYKKVDIHTFESLESGLISELMEAQFNIDTEGGKYNTQENLFSTTTTGARSMQNDPQTTGTEVAANYLRKWEHPLPGTLDVFKAGAIPWGFAGFTIIDEHTYYPNKPLYGTYSGHRKTVSRRGHDGVGVERTIILIEDHIESFHEIRTFAYARAKKDGFWLTCRNAIAQDGMEPALNLAPVFPEDGNDSNKQGSAAYNIMSSNNDNGAWGMFHPALALYDGQKFSEGLELKWNTTTTANTILLNKVGTDDVGTPYDQYKWWPNFSCSGLPFNGALAFPNGKPPEETETTTPGGFPLSYSITSGAEGPPTNARYTTNGILKGDTGGFYPYRLQSNDLRHYDNDGAGGEPTKTYNMRQYNVKRISSKGIYHPYGIISDHEGAFDNRNVEPSGTDNTIKNQTAYIGGSMNTKTGGVASYDATKPKPPRYKYWVLRIPVSIPEYTS
jgi:hypothetical protein